MIKLEDRSLEVFCCYPNKRPACANGFKDASADPKRIVELWAGRSGLLIAVPTGAISGFDVLDIDGSAGYDWLAKHPMPLTRVHHTRSGGLHFLFRHRRGLRCSQGVVAPGVDVRGDGGYVIWWPAHGYASGGEIADWPEGVLDAMLREHSSEGGSGCHFPTPAGADDLPIPTTIEREVTTTSIFKKTVARWSAEESHAYISAKKARDRLAKTPIGHGLRNRVLNGESFALGRQVARGWISGGEAVLWLWIGAQACQYVRDHGSAATIAVIRAGLFAGLRDPYPDLKCQPGERETETLH
jgi:hypothetical protein